MTAIPVSEVRFREDLYPRIQHSPQTVQQYAEDLSVLPPIEVNQHNELIDGWHRWTAHRKAEAAEISVTVTETRNEAHFLELAIRRNAAHGLQLSLADKREMAVKMYEPHRGRSAADRAAYKEDLASILSVDLTSVQGWLSRTDKEQRDKRNRDAWSMWLACHGQQAIAEATGLDRGDLAKFVEKQKSLFSHKPEATYAGEAWHPYNVWKKQDKTNAVSHGGNTEAEWLDRLVWGYTAPFDIVCDPFGGGGSTIDICRKRLRRYLVSDIDPIVERENEIRRHDVTEGPLKPPQWKDVRLVYLDPPYWKQQEYGNGPTDLSSMDANAFHDALAKVIKGYAAKVPAGCKVALIIQPTQWKAPDRRFTDHMAEMLRRIDLPIVQRIQAPYESQQCTAQMVEWAKDNREWLVLSREITVWEV